MKQEQMRLANQLCFSAYNVSRLFAQFYEKKLKQFGITYSQYLVLLMLWEENPQTLNSIGRHLDLSSNTLTPLLKRLEQSGWVKRERQQSDKRQLIITLTDNGQQQQEAVFEAISSCLPQEFDTTEYDETKYVFEELEKTLKHLIEK
ncbi:MULTISPECIES: MarR family winged helix-turn-helix transcriptional regulator [Staphylococcus]|uniref:MarR family winged helix-turn-helix transcriptional regulator n=1 Tax=Staphylococcus TaxID=1279 RepID=UPI00024E4ED3|nr:MULTISPECIES: MarR family transcriptional regulator [Staphylococcus]SLD02553.1 MarR family transcriptional regulator [Mycobacteroides abscessus subsp. massiliense]EHS03697.1 sugar-specific transcriptional regulator, TrmB family [Staphylococcus epidermidis VCU129]EJE03552.1 transcriptional regulator, MarR family [Staphylococcus epidermidis NIHLM037]MBC2998360.1 MarR family transcriptional regulator [Staphylococcus epidermidis]MBC3051210.1 MarR family transcriptional regulator [Staphylococcus